MKMRVCSRRLGLPLQQARRARLSCRRHSQVPRVAWLPPLRAPHERPQGRLCEGGTSAAGPAALAGTRVCGATGQRLAGEQRGCTWCCEGATPHASLATPQLRLRGVAGAAPRPRVPEAARRLSELRRARGRESLRQCCVGGHDKGGREPDTHVPWKSHITVKNSVSMAFQSRPEPLSPGSCRRPTGAPCPLSPSPTPQPLLSARAARASPPAHPAPPLPPSLPPSPQSLLHP